MLFHQRKVAAFNNNVLKQEVFIEKLVSKSCILYGRSWTWRIPLSETNLHFSFVKYVCAVDVSAFLATHKP